jgi:hypothetical protein
MINNIYIKNTYKLILNNVLIRDNIDNYNIILEYLSYIPFDLMNLNDYDEFIKEFDYDIERIKDVINIFKQY